jgi:hypothetical protein
MQATKHAPQTMDGTHSGSCSYQQVATSVPEAHLQRNPRLNVFGLERFEDGWPTGKLISGMHEWGQSVHKRLVLVYEDDRLEIPEG